MNALRWGVLGTGMIAKKLAGQLPETNRAELAAVGSRTAESAERFSAEFGGVAVGSYEELLACDDVDAVYISLPNGLHRDWTIRALEAGKHVLCEKPLARVHDEAVAMFDAAERCDQTLIEAFMYRCQPVIDEVILKVREGVIGELRLIRSDFTFDRAVTPGEARYDIEQAGGSLMDVGCYCTNLVRAIAGSEPESVHAVAHLHESGVDDWAAGTLTFPDGILATFTSGMRVVSANNTFLCGSTGYIELPFPWLGDGRYEIVGKNGRESFQVASPLPHYALEAERFAEVVQDGAAPWISREDTLGNLRVLDDLRKSAGVPLPGAS